MSAEADYLGAEREKLGETLRLIDDLLAMPSRSQCETIALGKPLQGNTGDSHLLWMSEIDGCPS